MRQIHRLCAVISLFMPLTLCGQAADSTDWALTAEVNGYYFDGDAWLLPIFKADRKKLHLETRYNYEDFKTFSGWVGYNFSGGKKFEFMITPMVGAATGQTKGVMAGLEFTLALGRFEFYSESEYLRDFAGNENNFLYSWSDLTYAVRDWWWIGISGQRTRLVQTSVDIQHGVIVGAAAGNWEFNLFAYNMELEHRLFILSIDFGF